MNNKQYQKNILLELLNLDEFKSSDFHNAEDVPIPQKEKDKKLYMQNKVYPLLNQISTQKQKNEVIVLNQY